MIPHIWQNNSRYIKMLSGEAVTHQANPARGFCTQTNSFLGPELLPALPGEQGRVARLLRKRFVCCEPALGTVFSPPLNRWDLNVKHRTGPRLCSPAVGSRVQRIWTCGGEGEGRIGCCTPRPRSAPPEK